ncbi:HAD-IA family hydrolase [Kitasatospora sp. NPDC101801]|uniref:HAD-IA family hydrolase n=1 Tax=Kitasatospora sp. NPDC101801 TaxID=3364103 RepID=UPI0037FCB077
MSNTGIILYGPPAAGKDTVTRELAKLSSEFSLFSRVKIGPGRSTGYRMGTPAQLAELRGRGAVVYENSRYESTYVTDRPGLDAAFTIGVPVMHLGQIEGVRAVQVGYPAQWLTVLLWCPREATASRSAGRGDADTPARLSAWDATRDDLDAHPEFGFDLVIDTTQLTPEQAAEQIRATIAPQAEQRLLLIDFDDTLIARLPAVTAWVTEYTDRHRLPETTRDRMLSAMRVRADRDVLDTLVTELDLPHSAEALWALYSTEFPKTVRPFPGVTEALTELRAAGWKVVIATNGGSAIQRAKLTVSGIADVVDGICISEEAGARKPDSALFHAAAAGIGLRLVDGGWMVGDNADLDIRGAQQVGLRTAWVSHHRSWADGPAPTVSAPNTLTVLNQLLNKEA